MGNSLLVHPVSKSGATHVNVLFPGDNQIWYDIKTYEKITHKGEMNVPVVYERIPGNYTARQICVFCT